ncbi:hypothetical protein H5410_037378 [Solanum commersonii]|uniref:Polyprotein n=1 Tax=Solanum commersonii TaxID=4109 RepID=A0A9J5Y7V4_SOLCO|nr:hypothetical protein H5410_037378 [Solanum commersonii]
MRFGIGRGHVYQGTTASRHFGGAVVKLTAREVLRGLGAVSRPLGLASQVSKVYSRIPSRNVVHTTGHELLGSGCQGEWIVDSGATHHVTADIKRLEETFITVEKIGDKVQLLTGHKANITHIGSLK